MRRPTPPRLLLLAAAGLGAAWLISRVPARGDQADAGGPTSSERHLGLSRRPGAAPPASPALDAPAAPPPAPGQAAAAPGGALGALADAGAPSAAEEPAAAEGSDVDPDLEPERAAEVQFHQAMRRVVRDLEFNEGLPEPPQQAVAPAPPTWTPDPVAEQETPPVIDGVWPASAPAAGGIRVTIRGRFLHPVQVMFGQAPARIVAATPEAVTVLAPPARAGPVAIALTNQDGNFTVASAGFTYAD